MSRSRGKPCDPMPPELMALLRESGTALAARAWDALKRSAYLPPSSSGDRPFPGLPRLLLWDDAKSFGDERDPFTLAVYELYAEHLRRYPVVRQATWRGRADWASLEKAVRRRWRVIFHEPTIEVRDASVPTADFAALMSEAASFHVPVLGFSDVESVTTDIGAVGIELFSREQPPAVLRFQWSWDCPPTWRPIVEWHARMKNFLLGCLPQDES